MSGWIKYLRGVRVETEALKRNKDLVSTRTLHSIVLDEGVEGSNPIADLAARRKRALCSWTGDRKSTRLNSSHSGESRMPSSA